MTCEEASALVTEAMEGALSDTQLLQFRDHLAVCGACARFAAQLEATVAVLRALPRAPSLIDERRLDLLCRRFRARRGGS